jgi:uncharacterized repeat protein (TIGR03847 family)
VSDSFDLEAPDHFVAGTVGPPGQRVFYLQAREADALVTLKVEKEQVAALAEYLGRLLPRLPAVGGEPRAPALPRIPEAPGPLGLLEPIEAAWSVRSLGAGYDEARDRIAIVANELIEDAADVEPATARFLVTREQAAAFVKQAQDLITAGRPLCPLCSRPKDAGGHICARTNGYLARS